MKMFGKIIGIFFISLLVFFYAIMASAFSIIKDGDYIKNELKENNIYKSVNDAIKDSVREKFDNFKDYVPDVNELIDKTITQDIIETEINDMLDRFYDNQLVKIDFDELLKKYKASLEKYLEENNIEMTDEIKEDINKLMTEVSINNIENEELDENPAFRVYAFRGALDIDSVTILFIIMAIIVLEIILSKNKLNSVYISSFISGGLLLQTYVTGKICGRVDIDSKYTEIVAILEDVTNRFLSNVFIYSITLIIIGAVLLGIDLFNKKNNDKSE